MPPRGSILGPRLVVLEEYADGLAVVDAADGLSKDGGNVENIKFRTLSAVLELGNRVGDEDLVDGGSVDLGDGISAEDAVGEKGIDFESSLTLEELGGAGNGVASINHVIDKDTDAVRNVTNKHHAGISVFGELDRTAFLGVI